MDWGMGGVEDEEDGPVRRSMSEKREALIMIFLLCVHIALFKYGGQMDKHESEWSVEPKHGRMQNDSLSRVKS